jgi:hypothetical protein
MISDFSIHQGSIPRFLNAVVSLNQHKTLSRFLLLGRTNFCQGHDQKVCLKQFAKTKTKSRPFLTNLVGDLNGMEAVGEVNIGDN